MRRIGRRLGGFLLVVAVAAAAGAGFASETARMTRDGAVHRIRIEPWIDGGKTSGTLLVHSIELSDGTELSRVVPATSDAALEESPILGVDPNDHSVLLLWVRNDAGAKQLRIARWKAGNWTAPAILDGPRGEIAQTRMVVGSSWIHVIWEERTGADSISWRGVYGHAGFAKAYGPELLPTTAAPDGGDPAVGGSGGPDSVQFLISLALPGSVPGGRGSIHVWGIRDEPVPIGYHQGHELPVGISDIQDLRAAKIRGTTAYWFRAGDRFIYRLYRDGAWGSYQRVRLDGETTAADALHLLEEMLRKR